MVSVSIKQLVEVVKTSFENDIQHEDISIDFDSKEDLYASMEKDQQISMILSLVKREEERAQEN